MFPTPHGGMVLHSRGLQPRLCRARQRHDTAAQQNPHNNVDFFVAATCDPRICINQSRGFHQSRITANGGSSSPPKGWC